MTNLPDACINPSVITDDDVLAFALGEASEDAVTHLNLCLSCQTKANALRQTVLVLERGAHPPSIKIGELVHGLVTAQEELVLSAHLRTCESCTQERALFTQLMSAEPAASAASVIDGVKRLVAQRVAPPATAMLALRGAGASETFTYRAESVLIHLRVERQMPARQRTFITGQVELRSGDLVGALASLFEGDNILVTEEIDDQGYFFFPAIRAGTYRIEVRVEDVESVIDPLVVE